jgi:hypothetical protein
MEVQYDHVVDHAKGIASVGACSLRCRRFWALTATEAYWMSDAAGEVWLRAATDLGVGDVLGIDRSDVGQELLDVERQKFNIVTYQSDSAWDVAST